MNNDQKVLDLLEVEELEKRYEMGWIGSVKVSRHGEGIPVH